MTAAASATPVRSSIRLTTTATLSPKCATSSPRARDRKISASALRRSDRLAVNVLKRSLSESACVATSVSSPLTVTTTVRHSKRVIERVIRDYEKDPDAGKQQLKDVALPWLQTSPARLTPTKREHKSKIDGSTLSSETVKRAIEFPVTPERARAR